MKLSWFNKRLTFVVNLTLKRKFCDFVDKKLTSVADLSGKGQIKYEFQKHYKLQIPKSFANYYHWSFI